MFEINSLDRPGFDCTQRLDLRLRIREPGVRIPSGACYNFAPAGTNISNPWAFLVARGVNAIVPEYQFIISHSTARANTFKFARYTKNICF